MRLVDCRGLACPQPVIITRRELETCPNEEVVACVDDPTARDNLLVLAEGLGRTVEWAPDGPGFRVTFRQGASDATAARAAESTRPCLGGGPLVVVLASDRLGQGEEALGSVLMKSFLTSLAEGEPPATVVCLSRGVFLSTGGSPVLDQMQKLEAEGVEILSCGTCLDFYERKSDLRVGKASNMFTILERMAGAGRLIQW